MASWMNEEQEDYVKSLAKIGPDKLCFCGWFVLGKCHSCPKDVTAAFKLANRCFECQNNPCDPKTLKIYHKLNCSKYES